jgi:hypothetical protein
MEEDEAYKKKMEEDEEKWVCVCKKIKWNSE